MKKKIFILVLLIIIALLVAYFVYTTNKKIVAPGATNQTPTTNQNITPATPQQGTNGQDQFRAAVPASIVVPEMNASLTPEQKKVIAVPTVVTPAAPGVSASFRSFDIKAENNTYTPSQIIGRVGDTIHVNFTAVDKDYDIVFPSYNMKQTALKGQTKILEFQAVQEGSFTYYCDKCGGPNGPTKGNIVIAK